MQIPSIPSRRRVWLAAALATFLAVATAGAGDWPWWRGPERNGVAEAGQDPPVEFGPERNVRWVAEVPGRGHGSPTVVGDRVFLAVADEAAQVQSLLCLDRDTGKRRWITAIHEGGFPETNKKASHASSTPACDGERVFINFVNGGAAHVTALSLEGEILWRHRVCDYTVHQGYGSSPAIHGRLVIVAADNKSGGAVVGLDRKDGALAWKIERPKLPNYCSPVVLEIGGRDQLVMQGCEQVSSFDPVTGETIWEVPGATTECVSSLVTDGTHVFTSGGYPRNHIAAVVADGSGKVAWENISRVYVPSMIVHRGHLFAVMDSGVAACWDAATGERRWRERLGGPVSGSPVLAGDRFYAGDEQGRILVFKADPETFERIAENPVGNETLSTPAICGGRIYARVADQVDGRRQEKLWCFERRDGVE